MKGDHELYTEIYTKVRSGKILTDEDIGDLNTRCRLIAAIAADDADKRKEPRSATGLEQEINKKLA